MDDILLVLHAETMNTLRNAQRLPDSADVFKNQAFGACMLYIRLFPDAEEIVCEYWNNCLRDAFERIEKNF